MESYFPHKSNSRYSSNVLRMRMSHGCSGYGVYYMLLERLREEPEYIGECDYGMLGFEFGADAELVRAVVEDFGLFMLTDDGLHFYSPELMESMKVKDAKKTKARESARARWNKKPASADADTDNVAVSDADPSPSSQPQTSQPEPIRQPEPVRQEPRQPEPVKTDTVRREEVAQPERQPKHAAVLSEAECMQRFDKLSEQVFDTDSAMWLDSVSNTYHIDDMHKAIAKFRKYVISISLAEKIRSLTDFKKYFVWRAESFLKDRSDDTDSYSGYGRGSLASRMPEEPGCGLIL